MGCISSKIMSRAVSFQQDRLNHHQRSHRNPSDMLLLKQELMSTSTSTHTHGNGVSSTDQFLALLCPTPNKIPTGALSFPSSNNVPKPATEVDTPPPYTHTTIEEQAVLQQQPQQEVMSTTALGDDDVLQKSSRRSKSCQWLSDDQGVSASVPGCIELLLDDEDYEINNLGQKKRGSTIVQSRSFHTVEEYDALLQKILLSSRPDHTVLDKYCSDPGSSVQPFESSILNKSQCANHNDVDDIQETAKSPWLMDKQHLLRDNNTVVEEGIGVRHCLESSSIIEESTTSSNTKDDGVSPERRIRERGLKRRAMAKGLESLKIPPSMEFPTPTVVTNLRKGAHFVGDQVYSPGAASYVTPKFGSYNNTKSTSDSSTDGLGKENWGGTEEEGILNPELVATFEECMRQLQLEEESLVKQMESSATYNGQGSSRG